VGEETCFFLYTWVRFSLCMSVTPAVLYMSTRLAGCLVGPGISCGAHKLAWTSQVIYIKKARKILKGIVQLIKFWVCFLEIISSSPTNLRAIENLYGR